MNFSSSKRNIILILSVFAVMAVMVNASMAQTTLTLINNKIVKTGETFTVTINVGNVTNLAGYQMEVTFNPTVLEAVSVTKGNFISSDGKATFCLDPIISNTAGLISQIACVRTVTDGVSGSGTLATITFKAITTGLSTIKIQNAKLSNPNAQVLSVNISDSSVNVLKYPAWDVNQDGVVDILDLVIVGYRFGGTITTPTIPNPDVNGDGKVDIADLTLVATHFGEKY